MVPWIASHMLSLLGEVTSMLAKSKKWSAVMSISLSWASLVAVSGGKAGVVVELRKSKRPEGAGAELRSGAAAGWPSSSWS